MKCLLAAFLTMLCLAGCADEIPEETSVQTTVQTESALATAPGLYLPDDPIEHSTDGAVRGFRLEKECLGMKKLGNDLLAFFSEEESTRLILYTGKNCAQKAEILLECAISPEDPWVQVNETGVAYYDRTKNALTVLDNQLQRVTEISLPEGIEGTPVLSQDLNVLYYCTGSDIRAFDLRAGYSRLLKSHQVQEQTLLQCCFDGSMLLCNIRDLDGDTYSCVLSAENGETLAKTTEFLYFETYEETYLLRRREGSIVETLFGSLDQETQALHAGGNTDGVYSALPLGCALTACTEPGAGTELTAYDLTSGKMAAQVTLNGVEEITAVLTDTQYVWLLSGEKLYCWDLTKSQSTDPAVYTSKRYTEENPDTEGLAACQTMAQDMSAEYGVDIRIWNDAVQQQCDHALVAEYQTEAIENGLAALDSALSQYPEGFLGSLGSSTQSGKLHICLVRSISGDLAGVQFWDSADAYIILEIGEGIRRAVYRQLSYVLDNFIIARSREYDGWESLNPEGFSYDWSYGVYQTRAQTPYLEGETRAFIDSYAMTYPKEDRAAIWEYAMMADCGEYFTSEVMQSKLLTICKAVREAFGWEASAQTFPWEQYLTAPLWNG